MFCKHATGYSPRRWEFITWLAPLWLHESVIACQAERQTVLADSVRKTGPLYHAGLAPSSPVDDVGSPNITYPVGLLSLPIPSSHYIFPATINRQYKVSLAHWCCVMQWGRGGRSSLCYSMHGLYIFVSVHVHVCYIGFCIKYVKQCRRWLV